MGTHNQINFILKFSSSQIKYKIYLCVCLFVCVQIPLNPVASSIPCCIFSFNITNTTKDQNLQFSLLACQQNFFVGMKFFDPIIAVCNSRTAFVFCHRILAPLHKNTAVQALKITSQNKNCEKFQKIKKQKFYFCIFLLVTQL